ncbi:MAG: glucosaminidase domain-containing protein [Rhodospirillaceae bacterium]
MKLIITKNLRKGRLQAGVLLVIAGALAACAVSFDNADRERRHQEEVAALHGHPIDVVSLDQARRDGYVPPAFLPTIRRDLSMLRTDARKDAFFKIVLPLIARENERIRDERAHLEDGADHVPEYIWEKYEVTPGDLKTLRRRVDIIPASLVMAQAAVESGWGTSRFATQANNLFGMRSYNPETPGLKPRGGAGGFKVIKYPNLMESVAHYMLNLNTHQAYEGLRWERAAARAKGAYPGSRDMARHLSRYSEVPEKYATLLASIIEDANLQDFDGIRIAKRQRT